MHTLDKLALRIIDLSYRHKLSHIGSCLTALPIIYQCYLKHGDRVVVSAGHSGLALYVVLEHFGLLPDAEVTLLRDGIHPVRNPAEHIEVSSGSLGMAATVAVGIALANPSSLIHIVSTDGEVAEGALWEVLYYVSRTHLENVRVHVNLNGYTALEPINEYAVASFLSPFSCAVCHYADPASLPPIPGFTGLSQHYHVMSESDYLIARAHYTPGHSHQEAA